MNARSASRLLRRLFWLVIGLVVVLQFPGDPARAAPLRASTSTISLIMSNPTCVESQPASGRCSIQIASLVASGGDPSFGRLEVLVNGKLRLLMAGFFEATAYVTPRMVPGGLAVTCGLPNAGGQPNFGLAYLLTANAYMADGTSASDSMTVFCPAYEGKTYLPFQHR
jgi:hypothetical protein